MDYRSVRNYLLHRPEAVEEIPFNPHVAVFKVSGKMFSTLLEQQGLVHINLKCDPVEALMLRDIFAAVLPGYHMNKRHWNTVLLDGSIPRGEIERMIDASYGLVVKGLTRRQRLPLELKYGPEQLYR